MTAFELIRQPALIGETLRTYGALTLEAPAGLTIVQLLGKPGSAPPADLPAGVSLRASGPGQWFAVSTAETNGTAIAASGFDSVDQSHGRVLIRVSGGPVRRMLAKGTAVDLHPDSFAIGMSAMTLIGHIGVNLTRTGEDEFELLVLRGFAESLWEDLIGMAREF